MSPSSTYSTTHVLRGLLFILGWPFCSFCEKSRLLFEKWKMFFPRVTRWECSSQPLGVVLDSLAHSTTLLLEFLWCKLDGRSCFFYCEWFQVLLENFVSISIALLIKAAFLCGYWLDTVHLALLRLFTS